MLRAAPCDHPAELTRSGGNVAAVSDLWLPGYEHDPEPGAGLSVSAGRPKVVLHTTESPRGSFEQVRNLWRGSANWGRGLPHFLADGPRIVQLLPLNVGAYTLENAPGGADTNRSGPAIQVERCRYAADEMTDEEYRADGKWLADLVRAGVDLDLSQHPRFLGQGDGMLATYGAAQRMSAAEYEAFNGFCGHQHVPENAHWDPGRIDGDRLELVARTNLGVTSPVTSPIPEEWRMKALVDDQGRWWHIRPDGFGRDRRFHIPDPTYGSVYTKAEIIDGEPVHLSGAELAALMAIPEVNPQTADLGALGLYVQLGAKLDRLLTKLGA